MKFGDFIRVMARANIFGCKQNEICIRLLNTAGIQKEVNEDAVAKWISRNPPDHMSNYFSDDVINLKELEGYLRRSTGHSWKTLQKEFSKENDYGVVNCVTGNREEFYHSLMKQFIILLKLPLPKDLEEPQLSYMDGIEHAIESFQRLDKIKLGSTSASCSVVDNVTGVTGSCLPTSSQEENV